MNQTAFVPSCAPLASRLTRPAVSLAGSAFVAAPVTPARARLPAAVVRATADNAGGVPVEEAAPAAASQRQSRKRLDVTVEVKNIKVGDKFEGVVTGVVPYGCFVDIGAGTDGLLHVSQLARSYVKNVADVVAVGDKIQVEVIGTDTKKNEISFKKVFTDAEMAAEPAPRSRQGGGSGPKVDLAAWLEETPIDKEEFLTGTVVSITDYGAFVNIGAPTDGMVHISQLAEKRVEKVTDIVKIGDEVQVRILEVDAGKGRISLSMKPLKLKRRSADDDDDFDYEAAEAEGLNDDEEEDGEEEEDEEEDEGQEDPDEPGPRKPSKMDEELKEFYESQPKFRSDFEIAYERALAKAAAGKK